MTIYTCDHRHTNKMPHTNENFHIQNATHLRCHTYEKVEMKHLIHEPQKPPHMLSCLESRVIYTNAVRAVCITNISKKTPQLIFGTQTCFFFLGGVVWEYARLDGEHETTCRNVDTDLIYMCVYIYMYV